MPAEYGTSFMNLPSGTVLRLTSALGNDFRVRLGEPGAGWSGGVGRQVEVLQSSRAFDHPESVTMHVATLEGIDPDQATTRHFAMTAAPEITRGRWVMLDDHHSPPTPFQIKSFQVEAPVESVGGTT